MTSSTAFSVFREQRCGGWEAFFCSLCSRLVDHMPLGDSVRDFLRQNMDHDLDDYSQVVFAAVHDRMVCFQSTTSRVVGTHSAMLRQDGSYIITHLDDHLAASASRPPATTSYCTLGPGEVLPTSKRIVKP